jgi:hypothetical protein
LNIELRLVQGWYQLHGVYTPLKEMLGITETSFKLSK